MTTEIHPPPMQWAQNRDDIFLTINIECKDPIIKLEKDSFYFKATGLDGKEYEVKIVLFAEIETDDHKEFFGRSIELTLFKKVRDVPFWPRLTSEGMRYHWLKTDFTKMEEDEDSMDEEPVGFNDMLQDLRGSGETDFAF